MNATLYFGNKKVKFFANIGWYNCNQFYLLNLNILEIYDNLVQLFLIRVAKFEIGIGFYLMEA